MMNARAAFSRAALTHTHLRVITSSATSSATPVTTFGHMVSHHMVSRVWYVERRMVSCVWYVVCGKLHANGRKRKAT